MHMNLETMDTVIDPKKYPIRLCQETLKVIATAGWIFIPH